MKVFLAVCALVAVTCASDAMTQKNVMGRVEEQLPWKAVEWTSGWLLGMHNFQHYTSFFRLYNLTQQSVYSAFYTSSTYQLIRSFVGCEAGISGGINTVFTVIDIGMSDGWTWQTLLFGALYLYAWYQQSFPAIQYYCAEFLSLV